MFGLKGYDFVNILKIQYISYLEKLRDWPDDASATSHVMWSGANSRRAAVLER